MIFLGGWLSTLYGFEEFDHSAREIYANHGIEYLHGKLFHHNKKQFKGWETDRKIALISDLSAITKEYLGRGFVFGTVKGRYEKGRAELGLNKNISALGFCLWGIIDKISKDEDLKEIFGESPDNTLSIFFESGNHNNGGLASWIEHIRHKFKLGWLKPALPVVKIDSPSVQIADFVTYFHARKLRLKISNEIDTEPDWLSLAFPDQYIDATIAVDFYGKEAPPVKKPSSA